MSTNSHIGIKLPENKVRWIYCHNDGYRSYMYPMLNKNYNTVEAVNALIDLGDASFIDKSLTESVFYKRDQNEDWNDVAPKTSLLKNWEHSDYNWLFDPETLKWERY